MNSIEALRAKLQAASGRNDRTQTKTTTGDNASYPFWNIDVNATATIRFLPDADTNNPYFWVERQTIKMPFSGVVGGDFPTEKDVTVTVPCVDMFDGMNCPVIAATKHMWDDPAQEDTARTYWKKRSYIFQGFVVNSPFAETNAPENPIRRFAINPKIYKIIYNSLMDPEMEAMPCGYDDGTDFRITKTQSGKWADYVSSKFSNRSRSLSEEERAAIDAHGLFDLKEYKGAVPTADHVEAIKAMFEDSLAGNPFDMESYGKYYRPYTDNYSKGASTVAAAKTAARTPTTQAAAPAPAAAAAPAAEEPSSEEGTNENAKAILARLRNRNLA